VKLPRVSEDGAADKKGPFCEMNSAVCREAWVAENPDHMIHFDGERFLGPYEPR